MNSDFEGRQRSLEYRIQFQGLIDESSKSNKWQMMEWRVESNRKIV